MKKAKVYWVYLLFLIFLVLPMASANSNLGYPIKIGQPVTLIQTCDNCTFVNVTTLKYPNSSIINLNSLMTKNVNSYTYTLNSSFTPDIGIYTYTTCGDLNGALTCGLVDFEITKIGTPLDLPKSIFYIVILLFSILVFGVLVYAGIYLPYNNSSDAMTGYILAVNNLKYLKIFLLGLAHVALIVILYFSYIISYSFLDMDFLGNILYFMFYASVAVTLPLFIVGVYILIANWVRDSKISDALSRGIRTR